MTEILLGCFLLTLINIFMVWLVLFRKRKPLLSDFYTDYVCGNLTLRIYKPEFEYQATGNIQRGTILDKGTLSPAYNWTLIEKKL